MARVPISWESLDSYISNYSGRTRVIRLLHIADNFPDFQVEAYRRALVIIENDTLDYKTHTEIVGHLNSLRDSSTPPTDLAWAQETERRANAITVKLENELKAYKNNLIKESIRMGQQDIAKHWANMGDLQSALRALVKNRDYCTTPAHVFQINMDIVNTGILLGQWAQVQTYVSKLEQSPVTIKEQPTKGAHLQAASALSLLSQEKYREAARAFLSIDSTIGTTYSHIISMQDIAKFTSLLAIATFDRADLRVVVHSANFKPFLELEVVAREALIAFCKSNYAECFSLIESMRTDMIADVYFSPHVARVFALIRERSYVQFASAFKVVPMSTISGLFRLPEDQVTCDLWSLIQTGKLSNTRIDMKQGILTHEAPKVRSMLSERLASIGEGYFEEVKHSLLHLEIARSDLQVDSKFLQHSTFEETAPDSSISTELVRDGLL